MKKILLALAISSTFSLAHASSIHSGSETGAYFNDVCSMVKTAIKKEYFDHECKTSGGTGDNIEQVANVPTDIGIGQWDIIAKTGAETLSIHKTDGLYECLYLVTNDPEIQSLKGISGRTPVGLPSEKSGSTLSFTELQTLDEGFGALSRITHYESASDAVTSVADGTNALAFFVQLPDTGNAVFKQINKAGLTFVPVLNRKILKHTVEGLNVYQPMNVNVTPQGLLGKLKGEDAPTIETTCTPIVVFTGKPESVEASVQEDQQALIKTFEGMALPEKGAFADIFSGIQSIDVDSIMSRFKQ